MGTSRSIILVSLLFNLFLFSKSQTEFTYKGFTGIESEIRLSGAAIIQPDGLLRLTNRDSNVTGTAFYHKPVRLLEKSAVRSFSTSFVFVIIPSSSTKGGFGFTFTISPTPTRPNADSAGFLGVFNKENNGNPRNHVFTVEFDTVQGANDLTDQIGNDIGLNYNNRTSDFQEPVVYYREDERKEDFDLESGKPIQAVLDYDGETQTLNFTVYPANLAFKPRIPLISRRIPKLLQVVQEEMFVGFTAATGKEDESSAHYIMGWSFSTEVAAERLNISELPPPPKNNPAKNKKKRGLSSQVIAMIVALSSVMIIMFVLLYCFVMYKKRLRQEEILEDWEIDHPRRFKYRDLYVATDGFKENRIIGVGGFGVVYRGNVSSSSDQIAVKKITPNSMQGVREFVAEIESLGKLRHKNLVNLQGWCKHKNDLLLIYDYIPNGSLDSLLYSNPRRSGVVVLSWNARFGIAKGIASGLLYLHEEWEKIVIHRDVKPSNVLIDDEMNPRLGDFGLARLYERGSSLTQSRTTALVGTIGYVAPELARNGKPSCASDVFAFGVLLLEIVSGKKPTDSSSSGSFFLVDWVMELHSNGEIVSVIDPRLGSDYDEGEAKLAITVGLLCCHQNAASRPSMRMVLRYLNGDEDVPEIDEDDWGYSNSSRSEFGSRFVGFADSSSSSSAFSFATRVSSTKYLSANSL